MYIRVAFLLHFHIKFMLFDILTAFVVMYGNKESTCSYTMEAKKGTLPQIAEVLLLTLQRSHFTICLSSEKALNNS